ncbi:MAG: DHH family phosphoesterase, partial [Roseiflexaceae bacterium]|nr:DHH family phosphoesterase [Roseiflexaceae bacterium]
MELIVTHSYTDFDGLGAQLAASKLFPRAIPLLSSRLRENVAEFIALFHEHLPFVEEDDLPDEPVSRLIVVDTPHPPALPGLDDEQMPTLIFDHHPRISPPRPHEELIHAEVGAATTILVERLASAGITLSSVEATLMLLGIYDDTGNLSYASTRQQDVAAAAWLLGQGARIAALDEFLRRPLSPEQEHIFHQLDQHGQHLQIEGWSVLLATAHVAGDAPQLSPLAEKLRDLYEPAVTVLAIATGQYGTPVILRANPPLLDAGELARGFGGGG